MVEAVIVTMDMVERAVVLKMLLPSRALTYPTQTALLIDKNRPLWAMDVNLFGNFILKSQQFHRVQCALIDALCDPVGYQIKTSGYIGNRESPSLIP